MNAFESLIGKTFQPYRDAKIASLIFIHPPMRIAGLMGKVPCFIQAGKAPFDAAGVYYDEAGTAIGVELKETSSHDTSLAIVHPEKKGSGLHYHQLKALVEVHKAGGVALCVWSNGGEVGVIDGPGLQLALLQYDTSMKAENSGKTPAKGSRSILWGHFKPVKYGHNDLPLWLPESPAKRRKKSA